MTDLSREILDKWQVRKTKAQKDAFIAFLQEKLPGLQVEAGGFPKSRNLVLGDVGSAKFIVTAHYDTCARMFIPNFITPKNIPVYLLYNLAVVIPFLAVMYLSERLISWLTNGASYSVLAGWAVMMVGMYYTMMGGPANKHTANDNTSGVITLCELYAAMTPEQRQKVCFVFFDNEEYGLLGSGFFAKKHKKQNLKSKLLLNFDCVSDGDTFLVVHNKSAGQRYGQALATAFQSIGEKTVELCPSSKAFYPSDQANFPTNAAVSSMKRHKLVGLYMNKIHTKHDTVFDERNIHFLTDAATALLDKL